MNGAVVGSMRYYGGEYGLNYGVSLPTIRSLAQAEGKDHKYSCYLFQQQVREIRLASLHIAEAESLEESQLDFWAEGIINSEVAEEASFALFQYVKFVDKWLLSDNELLQYTAILSIAKSGAFDISEILTDIGRALERESLLLTSATVTLLENYYREPNNRELIDNFVASLPKSSRVEELKSEFEWRRECYL